MPKFANPAPLSVKSQLIAMDSVDDDILGLRGWVGDFPFAI